jgi:hypothetical protein
LTPAKRLEVTIAVLEDIRTQNFWNNYIAAHNPATSLTPFADYLLWNVDLKNEGKLPKPWIRTDFVQTHFGENAPAHAPLYDRVDRDRYDGTLKQLLSFTVTGLVFDKTSTPVCQIVWDLQQSLKDKVSILTLSMAISVTILSRRSKISKDPLGLTTLASSMTAPVSCSYR